jgi:hypothetical protein
VTSFRWIRDGLIRHETLLFAALIGVLLLPVWGVRYLPTQDGAAHLYNASVLRDYDKPGSGELRRYFVLTKDLDPYWTVNLALAWLLRVFPPNVAEKILVSAYFVLLPLSVRFLLGVIHPRSKFVSWLTFPFAYNHLFQMGFYNFSLGVACYGIVLGLWLRHVRAPSIGNLCLLGALGVFLYFTHVSALWMSLAGMTVIGLWRTAADAGEAALGRIPGRELWNRLRRVWLEPLAAFLPSLYLAQRFLTAFVRSPMRPILPPLPFKVSMRVLNDAQPMFGGIEETLYFLATRALFAAACYAVLSRVLSRRPSRLDGFFLVPVVFLVLFFMASQSEAINERLLPFLVVSLIACVGLADYNPDEQGVLQLSAAVVGAALVFTLLGEYRRVNRSWEDCLSATRYLEPGRTMLYIPLEQTAFMPTKTNKPNEWVCSMRHTGCYAALERGAISFNDYEAEEKFLPVQYRDSLNPYRMLGGYLEAPTPHLNLLGYPARSGGTLDYILVWGATPQVLDLPYARPLLFQLHAGYDKIYQSPSDLTILYRRKGLGR